jgi:Flp pilus assembly protein CpaB
MRLHRHRRGLAATASGLAVLCLGVALRPADPSMVGVVVAARDLPTGHRLSAEDLAIALVPEALLPAGATSEPETLAGVALAAPALRGEPVSRTRLVPSLAELAAPPGTVPTPVRFADPAAVGLLSAGQAVDVLAARSIGMDEAVRAPFPGPARVLAACALVLAVLASESGPHEALPIGADAASAPLVVLALTPDQALAVAGAEPTSRLSFTLGQPRH